MKSNTCSRCNDKGTKVGYCIRCGKKHCYQCSGNGYVTVTSHNKSYGETKHLIKCVACNGIGYYFVD